MARVLRASAVLTIAGLAFMLWSLVKPTAMPVVLAMSVGQMLGTMAFAMFGWVVFSELREGRRIAAEVEAAKVKDAKDAKDAKDPKDSTSGDRT